MRIDIVEDKDGKTVKLLVSEEKFSTLTLIGENKGQKLHALEITEEMERLIANEHYEY